MSNTFQVKDLGSGIAYGGLRGAGYLFDLLTIFSPNKPDVSVGREFGTGVTTVWPMVQDVIAIATGRTPGPWGQKLIDNVQSGIKSDFNKAFDRFQNKPESK